MRRRIGELLAGEIFHFFADNRYATLIGGVEFEDAGSNHFRAVELFGESENGGCLAGTWRAVKEHMRELILIRLSILVIEELTGQMYI